MHAMPFDSKLVAAATTSGPSSMTGAEQITVAISWTGHAHIVRILYWLPKR
jgi:hypothetical protein